MCDLTNLISSGAGGDKRGDNDARKRSDGGLQFARAYSTLFERVLSATSNDMKEDEDDYNNINNNINNNNNNSNNDNDVDDGDGDISARRFVLFNLSSMNRCENVQMGISNSIQVLAERYPRLVANGLLFRPLFRQLGTGNSKVCRATLMALVALLRATDAPTAATTLLADIHVLLPPLVALLKHDVTPYDELLGSMIDLLLKRITAARFPSLLHEFGTLATALARTQNASLQVEKKFVVFILNIFIDFFFRCL